MDGITVYAFDYREFMRQWEAIHGNMFKTMNSLHLKRLAVDFNFFVDGKLVYDKKVLAPLGAYWESLHPLNSWGGNGLKLVDTPHFSRGDGKPEWRRVT